MTETFRLMLLLKELSGIVTRRDGQVLSRLQKMGYRADVIEDGLRGIAAARDGHLSLPEGALRWLQPGEPFGAALLLYRDTTSGRRVIDLAGDAWRKQPFKVAL